MPCDFPIKSGSQIYIINVGICLLMCSWKLYCVPNFGDFCSWKHNFGVGLYGVLKLITLPDHKGHMFIEEQKLSSDVGNKSISWGWNTMLRCFENSSKVVFKFSVHVWTFTNNCGETEREKLNLILSLSVLLCLRNYFGSSI